MEPLHFTWLSALGITKSSLGCCSHDRLVGFDDTDTLCFYSILPVISCDDVPTCSQLIVKGCKRFFHVFPCLGDRLIPPEIPKITSTYLYSIPQLTPKKNNTAAVASGCPVRWFCYCCCSPAPGPMFVASSGRQTEEGIERVESLTPCCAARPPSEPGMAEIWQLPWGEREVFPARGPSSLGKTWFANHEWDLWQLYLHGMGVLDCFTPTCEAPRGVLLEVWSYCVSSPLL